jgi:tetratricopeptide (TPR) repeat protein
MIAEIGPGAHCASIAEEAVAHMPASCQKLWFYRYLTTLSFRTALAVRNLQFLLKQNCRFLEAKAPRNDKSYRLFVVLSVALISSPLRASDQPHWLRISSPHFELLTDAGQKKGHEIAARFEQMRAVFADLLRRKQVHMGEPIEIIAVASPEKYRQLAPGDNANTPAFWIADQSRVFILLNASDPDCWRAIEHSLAHYFLNYNYPPTQPWFDEGIAEYFSSLYFTVQKTELGSDPELNWPRPAAGAGAGQKSFTELLDNPVWLNLSDLLEMKNRVVNGEEGTHHTLFYAQSWILVHYLINKDKLSETGAYFGLVELQKIPVAEAVQQAFGMSVAQLDQALKDYFHSLKPLAASLAESKRSNPPPTPEPVIESMLPVSLEDVSTTDAQLAVPEATALVDEMELRIPEHRQQATQELGKLASDEKTESVAADRALAWAELQKGQTKEAFEQLNSAMQINPSDAWTRFELAQTSYQMRQKGAKVQGLANMMESLHTVIDRYPEFAEAYNMLGWARLTGGGANAATETMKMAVQLNPRSEQYQLLLAEAEIGAKKWDDGAALLNRLQDSHDPQIASAAKKELYELPFVKKYGIAPQEQAGAKAEPSAGPTPQPSEAKTQRETSDEESSDEDSSKGVSKPAAPAIDKRPVQFLKGKLVSVDCSQAPAATLEVSKGPRTLKLRTSDYKSLVVLGSEKFSCEWKDVSVGVNYRAGKSGEGELVSVEVQ